MSYSVDSIYRLVGRDDKVATLSLDPKSSFAQKYGAMVTVVFVFNQFERKHLENNFVTNQDEGKAAVLKFRYLTGEDLSKEQIQVMEEEGINSGDIIHAFTSNWPTRNTYHSTAPRSIEKMNIEMKIEPKGRDYDWIYGFTKQRLRRGTGLPPDEMDFFYACKFYYEPDQFTVDEKEKAFTSPEILKPEVELKLIEIKIHREEDTPEDWQRFEELYSEVLKKRKAMELLSKELLSAGTSLKKLYQENPQLLFKLYMKLARHKDIHLNVLGRIPVYLSKDRVLHIYLRHVSEFQVSDHFKDKDNFQWPEKEIINVMSAVIANADGDIQAFWEKSPGNRYSRFGKNAYYYEGDYYTFHIEGDGSLSTFHKNKK